MRKQRVLYLLVLLFSVAFAVFYWEYLAVVLLLVVAATPVCLYLPIFIASFFIRVRMEETAAVVRKGEAARFHIILKNSFFFHFTRVRLTGSLRNRFGGKTGKEVLVFPLGARNVTTLTVSPVSSHCGSVEMRLERLRLCDWLGITSRTLKPGCEAHIAVLPEIFQPEGEPPPAEVPDVEGTHYSNSKRGDDSSQVFDYHEYRDGDRVKDIHWKLSARMDRLMVREFSLPIASAAAVALDCGGGGLEGFDLALEGAASVSARLLELGIIHDFVWISPENGLSRHCMQQNEDLFWTLQKLYEEETFLEGCPLPVELASGQGLPYAQLYYAAAALSEEALPALSLLAQRVRLTVLYCGDEGYQPLLEAMDARPFWLCPGGADSVVM